jgi:hypothetical protein
VNKQISVPRPLVLVLAMAAFVAAVASQAPEIQRYLKVKQM